MLSGGLSLRLVIALSAPARIVAWAGLWGPHGFFLFRLGDCLYVPPSWSRSKGYAVPLAIIGGTTKKTDNRLFVIASDNTDYRLFLWAAHPKRNPLGGSPLGCRCAVACPCVGTIVGGLAASGHRRASARRLRRHARRPPVASLPSVAPRPPFPSIDSSRCALPAVGLLVALLTSRHLLPCRAVPTLPPRGVALLPLRSVNVLFDVYGGTPPSPQYQYAAFGGIFDVYGGTPPYPLLSLSGGRGVPLPFRLAHKCTQLAHSQEKRVPAWRRASFTTLSFQTPSCCVGSHLRIALCSPSSVASP